MDDAVCQIFLHSETRDKIVNAVKSEKITSSLFEEAVVSVVKDMYSNTSSQFWLVWLRDHGELDEGNNFGIKQRGIIRWASTAHL